MDFSYNEQQRMVADTLSRYLAQNYPIEFRHSITRSDEGWSPTTWAGLCELGMIGALFGEDAGGFGGEPFDIAIVFEQLGRALVVEPFLGTLMAGRVLARTGIHQPLIDRVIAGSAIVCFAHEEAQSRYALESIEARATRGPDGWTLEGVKVVVPQLSAATHFLLSARHAGGIGLFLVDAVAAGVAVRRYPMIDGGHGGDLRLSGAPGKLVAAAGTPLIEEAIAAGIVALSWEAVGIMDVLKEQTLEYLRIRKQFGAAIGSFQALQHRIANCIIALEQARSSAINAAAALDGERGHREATVSAAKYTIGLAGKLFSEEAIQMHGGIGMTWELPLAHYAKRLTMIDHQLGDEDHHLERFIALRTMAA